MLTPDYYSHMDARIQKIYQDMERQLIEDISRGLAKDISKITAGGSVQYKIDALNRLGYTERDIIRTLMGTTGHSGRVIESIMRESAYLNHVNDQIIYGNAGKVLMDRNAEIDRYITQAIKNANNDIANLTKTMGVTVNGKNQALMEFYRNELNGAMLKVGSGVYNYNDAVKQAVKKLSDSGIRTIDYASGKSDSLDVAVKRAVRTANAQVTGRVSLENADLMGQDLMEITSHWGARPSHAEWQGQVVSRSGNARGYLTLDDIGYETGWGFQGWNCRHDWFPYFEGISSPAGRTKEPAPVTIDGKTYTYYEATQRQREFERRIRRTRNEIAGYKGAGLKDELSVARAKLKRQRAEYKRFSENVAIRPKWERVTINGQKFTVPPKVSGTSFKSGTEAFKSFSLKGIDKDFAKEIENRLLDLANTYRIHTKDITVLTGRNSRAFGYHKSGAESLNSGGYHYADDLFYSNNLHKTKAISYDNHLQTELARGKSRETVNALATIDHEYGHAIDHWSILVREPELRDYRNLLKNGISISRDMSIQDRNNLFNALRKTNETLQTTTNRISTEIFEEMRKNRNMPDSAFNNMIVSKEFGTYATKNKKEFLAEGFSIMRHTPPDKRSPFLKEFAEIFERRFKELSDLKIKLD